MVTRVGLGHPRMYISFVSLLCRFPLSSYDGKWGEGEREAPLGRYGSLWVTAGGPGRGWDLGKNVYKTPPVALGQLRSRPSGHM